MRTAFFSAAMLASSLAGAAIPIDGWYASFFGGYTLLPNNHLTIDPFETASIHPLFASSFLFNPLGFSPLFPSSFLFNRQRFNTDFDLGKNGVNVGARIGFQGGPMRYEGEFTYIGASTTGFDRRHHRFSYQPFPFFDPLNSTNRLRGETNAYFAMANVYYDFPEVVPCLSPFVGFGIGYGLVQYKIDWNSEFFFFPWRYRTSDNAFSYQGTAGLTFNFDEAWALNFAYRYIGTTKLDNIDKTFQAHLASIGLVYRFNECNYK